jgi:predicted HicB family RNase H-like nuclease
MKKNLAYYMKLPYTIVIKTDEDNDGSVCYVASLLEMTDCIGVGKTPAEAAEELELHKRLKLEAHLELGISIPEPQTKYSGNINIRVDSELHARLALEAAASNMSLNKYTTLILERRKSDSYNTNPVMVGERKSNRYKTTKH